MGGGEGKPPHPRTVLGRLKTWLTPGYDEISFSPPRSLRRKLQFHLRISFSNNVFQSTKKIKTIEGGENFDLSTCRSKTLK